MQDEANDNLSLSTVEGQIQALDGLISFRPSEPVEIVCDNLQDTNARTITVNPRSGGGAIVGRIPSGQGLLQQIEHPTSGQPLESYRIVNTWDELMRNDEPTINLYTGRRGLEEFDRAMREEINPPERRYPLTEYLAKHNKIRPGFFELIKITS